MELWARPRRVYSYYQMKNRNESSWIDSNECLIEICTALSVSLESSLSCHNTTVDRISTKRLLAGDVFKSNYCFATKFLSAPRRGD